MTAKLFTPIQLGGVTLPNRIVVSPMCQYSAADGAMSDWHLAHLGSLACSGAGLMIIEATGVTREGRISNYCTGLYHDLNEAAMKRAVEVYRGITKSPIGVQLAHAGRKGSTQQPWAGGKALGPAESPWQTVAPLVIEGITFGALAVGAKEAWIYIRHGYGRERRAIERAIKDAPLEGKRGEPLYKPPYPGTVGLHGKPTLINNVETFANVPAIVRNGPEWFAAIGAGKSKGTKVFSLSGRVRKPGNYELPFGTTFRELIYTHGGGVQDSRSVKAIMPAGASSSLVLVDKDSILDTPMDYASVRTLGSDLGSASVIVIDDSVSIEWLVNKTVHFFRHESCGKCTPCREGTYWMSTITERIRSGHGTSGDVDLLLNVARQIQGKCLCALGEFSTMAVVTGIERFPQDFHKAVQPAPSPAITENQRA